jgi:hypothetical protein
MAGKITPTINLQGRTAARFAAAKRRVLAIRAGQPKLSRPQRVELAEILLAEEEDDG